MEPRQYPRLLGWWQDDPADPGRSTLDRPAVQRLIAQIAPGSRATDLGGVMSLNVRLEPANVVLRVHQPFVSRQWLLAVQAVRRCLAKQGLIVPVPGRLHCSRPSLNDPDVWELLTRLARGRVPLIAVG